MRQNARMPGKRSVRGAGRRIGFLPFSLKELEWAERRTYIFDSIRGAVDGVTFNLDQAVYLLVAIQFFSVPDLYTSLISSSKFVGLLATLFLTVLLGGRGLRKSSVVGFFTVLSGVLLGISRLLRK